MAANPLSSGPIMATDVPVLTKDKHVQYWFRCLRTVLPTAYTANDANRMTLTFFILSALDLLGVLFSRTTASERQGYADWIYQCQHPHGGFRGFPGTDLGSHSTDANRVWDPASLPATYFALAALAVLGDDMKRVDRRKCLDWIRTMQREDGSFGELLGVDGHIEGGRDTRFAYSATAVRWILRGYLEGDVQGVPDIDVDRLVHCIQQLETYDGGISEEPFKEAHAGFTFCAIASLSFVGRLASSLDHTIHKEHITSTTPSRSQPAPRSGLTSHDDTIRWLTGRLTTTIEEDDFEDEHEQGQPQDSDNSTSGSLPSSGEPEEKAQFVKYRSMPLDRLNGLPSSTHPSLTPALIEKGQVQVHWTGFSGRCNKIADTCYSFWVGAALKMLGSLQLVDLVHVRCYLLEKVQHLVAGGFGKLPGDPPDIYHAYLGLTALAIIDGREEDGAAVGPELEDANTNEIEQARRGEEAKRSLRAVDPALCVSLGAKRWIETLDWRKNH